jgi:serine/threonine protein kinase
LPKDGRQRFFISVEQPQLTLSGVVRSMLINDDCQRNAEVRRRYGIKALSLLRLVAKAVQRLHSLGYVHGNICLENFGKFKESWKLVDLLGAQRIDHPFELSRLSSSAPPETVEGNNAKPIFGSEIIARESFDSWSFGKLAYEVLVGDALIEFDGSKYLEEDELGLAALYYWDEANVKERLVELERVGVPESVRILVAQCLARDASLRPSMDEILRHPVWSELRRPSAHRE